MDTDHGLHHATIQAVELALGCSELDQEIDFFCQLGFQVDAIYPADQPREAVLSGYGLRLRLTTGHPGHAAVLHLLVASVNPGEDLPQELRSPAGTRIVFKAAQAPLEIPPLAPEFLLTRAADDAAWIAGRAGMQYRDLIPGRLGGRFIASQIRIPEAGAVPDYVHYHRLRFQIIYCLHGWVRVVYQDQGAAFVLHPGDCILQAPGIRHRVLESSAGLEVLEISCPAEHETHADRAMILPTNEASPGREYGGPRFVRHVSQATAWTISEAGFEQKDFGIAAATQGLASVAEIRPGRDQEQTAASELHWLYVLRGKASLRRRSSRADAFENLELGAGDCISMRPGTLFSYETCSQDFELLEVCLPAR